MSDFEKRLSDALSAGAEATPDATGLAAGARRRARARRRTTVLVAAAAVVAAVAVPVGVMAARDEGPRGGDNAADPSPSPTPSPSPADPGAPRVETYHDMQVEVPSSWGHGSRSAWCTGGEATEPVVERPGTITPTIGCSPSMSHGLTFGSSAAVSLAYPSGHVWRYDGGNRPEYAPGTWLGYWYDEDDLVSVAAPDRATVQEVLASVQVVGSVDGNGCPVRSEEGRTPDSDRMSVCRYDADGLLEQSELLSPEDTRAALAALDAAPEGERSTPGESCAEEQPPRLVVDLRVRSGTRSVVLQAPCPYNPGVMSADEPFKELTEDVLYWALSPGWSGSAQEGVALPEALRALPEVSPSAPATTPAEESACPLGYYASSDFSLDPDSGDPMTVCRMELSREGESGGSYLLADVTELSAAESAAVRAAVAAAPRRDGEGGDVPQCDRGPGEFFLVVAGEAVPLWVYNVECGEMTALTATENQVVHHEVTPDLLDALGSAYGPLR